MSDKQRRMRTQEAAEYVGLAKSTLEKMRIDGGGPTYLKLGKAVVYEVADLDAWCRASRRSNTAQIRTAIDSCEQSAAP